jgi:hypothetical protein
MERRLAGVTLSSTKKKRPLRQQRRRRRISFHTGAIAALLASRGRKVSALESARALRRTAIKIPTAALVYL